ncbi:HNH endonuclease signature motif containing protein [Geobacter anodireducens]
MDHEAVAIHSCTDLPTLFPVRYGEEVAGEAELSSNDPCWDRATYMTDDAGYMHLSAKGRPRRALHQILWERFHQRNIPPGAVIHHMDCNPRNNSFGNLLCLPRAMHRELHGELNRLDPGLSPLLLELERHRITEFYRLRSENYWNDRGAGLAPDEGGRQ